MTGPDATHRDVAAYALGVLDDIDAAHFEEHLVECGTCAMELESFLPVTSLLSQVDGDSLVGAEELVREGRMLDEMVNAVAYDRSRVRARRMLALAAGVVALVLVGGLSVIVGAALGGGDEGRQPVAERSYSPSPKSTDQGPGIGGPMEGPGERFSGTDPATKVHADVLLESAEWGTQVSLLVSSVTGPKTCQLVAVGDDGLGEIVYTWTVPKKGYGTEANPQPLFLQGATAVTRSEIKRMEVQAVDNTGKASLLVAVNT
jgi:hypothetical protein